jgi:hypothetical protein
VGRVGALLCAGLLLTGCVVHSSPAEALSSLSVGVAELELQLRDDPYRSFAKRLPDGRNVFEALRWQLERLQRQRAGTAQPWSAQDFVLEFARARTLERAHLYADAALAYERVAASSSRLAPIASGRAAVMRRFSAQKGPLPQQLEPEQQLREIEARTASWLALAEAERQPLDAALAREEAETWEVLRVETLARAQGSAAALQACTRLLERHRDSKLYPEHLLRLGDLHAQAARSAALRARAERAQLSETPYQQHLDGALAAYEQASEARSEDMRRAAQARLQGILSFHGGANVGLY